MQLVLFVHECHLEVGHSNAMIETINNSQDGLIDHLEVVAFTSSPVNELFPKLQGRVSLHLVPGKGCYPFLLKALYYQIYTFLYSILFHDSKQIKISIGTAALHSDVVNVQFVHSQWQNSYMKELGGWNYKKLYKWILYKYFDLCEHLVYGRKKIKFMVLARFVTTYLKERYKIEDSRIETIYSGINLERFQLPKTSREDLLSEAVELFPQLKAINFKKPIYLFIGAFERKGLTEALSALGKVKDAQIVVIGKSESQRKFMFPDNLTICHIEFTDQLQLFYALADCFIFPTKYEPFGLVVIEAVAMGMQVIIPPVNVGAAEIIGDLDAVWKISEIENFDFEKVEVMDIQAKELLREKRLKSLSKHNWSSAGDQFSGLLKKVAEEN